MCFVYHSNDIHMARSSRRFVGLSICVIGHLNIEFSVVDGSTIRVGIINNYIKNVWLWYIFVDFFVFILL